MKAGWQVKPLQALCNDLKQDIVDGPFGSELQRKDYLTQGIPVLKIQNIKPFAIELKKMDYVSPAKFQELKRHSYRRGDIVMTKLGNPLGVSAIVEDLDEGVIVADLVRIRAQRVNTKYLCYHLNSQRTNDFINSKQKGTTRPRVTLTVVRELPIAVPSPEEQQRIVAILDQAFDGIATAKANAKKNLQNSRALFESHLQSVFTQRGEGWVEKRLGDIANLIDCLHKTPTYVESGFPMVRVTDIKPGFLDLSKTRKVDEKTFIEFSKKRAPKAGDIVFSRVGSCGVSSLVNSDIPFCLGQNTVFILAKIHSMLLYYFLNSPNAKAQFEKLIEGTTQPTISLKSIREIIVPIAPPDEHESIVVKFDALRKETQRLASLYQRKLTALDALKQSLLHQAFSGQL